MSHAEVTTPIREGIDMAGSQAPSGDQTMHWFWKDVGDEVADALTAEQRNAIELGLKKSAADGRPADIRLHLGKYFVRIIAGKERRGKKRLEHDRSENPVFTLKNAPLIALLWGLSLLVTLYALTFIVSLLGSVVYV